MFNVGDKAFFMNVANNNYMMLSIVKYILILDMSECERLPPRITKIWQFHNNSLGIII